jgi:hypothetical protein
MSKTKALNIFLFTVVFLFALACARISQPTGGPKDSTPPVVLKCVPENKARNFKGKSISITFDEYVILDNINDKFMISPPMKKKPKVLIKGKSVVVDFLEPLRDSTTYTLNFQDAIRDLNANNIFDNYQYVFSTGADLDSLSVTGNVFNSFNLEVPEKTDIFLYRDLTDSAVIKKIPDYISKLRNTGYFRIDNIREGIYRLFAIKDDDNSKNYNRNEEAFAFMDSVITVSPAKSYIPVVKDTAVVKKEVKKGTETSKVLKKSTEPVFETGENKLIMFLAKRKNHYLSGSSRDTKYTMNYILSLPPGDRKVDLIVDGFSADKYIIDESSQKDTLKVWITDSTLYKQETITTYLTYPFTDSLGAVGYKKDTIPMRFITPRATRAAKIRKPALVFASNFSNGFLKPGESIYFRSETPFRQPDTTMIKFYEIKDTLMLKVPYTFVRDTSDMLRYNLSAKIVQGKKYLFIARKGAFGNIYSEQSDSVGTRFAIKDPESYGKLTFNIHNCPGDVIIQLLNGSEKLISQAKAGKDGNVVFPLLETGTYRARVIYDTNGDGIWTTGDYIQHRQPEAVSYYYQELEIKSDYYVEQPWDISLKNVKDQKLMMKPKK